MAEEILDKFQAGDEGAFELLLGEYRPLIESQVKSAVRKRNCRVGAGKLRRAGAGI